jgi:polyhydroxybutyrate depolymerase
VNGAVTYHHDMEHWTNGFRRSYRVHFPSGYNPERSYPLVVVIHGAFDTAEGVERFTGFSDLADREGFIVMYPNGIGLLGYLQHWNAGHCCGKAFDDRIDDVGFVTTAIEEFSGRFTIDRNRIYVTGFSNGGMLTYLLGAERSDLFAAIAPVAASFGGKASAESPEWQPPVPSRPMPVLVIHGLADSYVPVEGGFSERRGGTASFLSVPESVRYWVEWNRCPSGSMTKNQYSSAVHQTIWENCDHQTRVVLYILENWGHLWPGPFETRALDAAHPLKPFDGAEIIWQFFRMYTRDDR